jgi:hypothetical protein
MTTDESAGPVNGMGAFIEQWRESTSFNCPVVHSTGRRSNQ